jgi:m7GpppX diphosphatase
VSFGDFVRFLLTNCLFLVELKVSIIYPATEKHILKFTVQELHMIDETPEIYEKVTLPYLEKEQFTLDWVYNILEHKQEVDKIIYEDSDFILLPDYKWNGQKESLYLLAIITDRTIKSLRDLNGSHLPLLSSIQSKSLEAIKSKFDLDASQIRAYFHYQPSFYHLHVHFTYLKFDAPGIFCEKSHLLTTVISNLRLLPDYYQKATLPFAAREKDKLYAAYKEFIESQTKSP